MMGRKLKLLKVIVQPVFIVDDDEEGLSELVAQSVVVPAKDWESFPAGAFSAAFEALREQVEEGDVSLGDLEAAESSGSED